MPVGSLDLRNLVTALSHFHSFFSRISLLGMLFVPFIALAQPDDPGDLNLAPLRSWIKVNWYDGQFTNLGYNQARIQMYGFVDAYDGEIECIYTGFQQESGFVTYPNPINAEHIVPQSFYGSASPMKSDIWSIRPCHGSANSARSNDGYGEVPDGEAQWYGVSSLGAYLSTGSEPSNSSEFSEGSGDVWEPREEVKGDVARSVFYFYTMYPTQAGDISGLADPAVLYQWHLDDPVAPVEVTRNNRAETAQGNRNPYIDHPEWVYDAWFWEPPADIPGCTSSSACNYDAAATLNDGSCLTVGMSCNDGNSSTFNDVYTDCGAPNFGCEGEPVVVLGCTSGSACNYDASANLNDGSCVFEGDPCDDGDAMTFNDMYTDCSGPDYGCLGTPITILGCMSGSACNYDPAANLSDGSCIFEGDPCDDGDATTYDDNYTNCSQFNYGCAGTPSVDDCPADLDGDGIVAVGDVLSLLGEFGCLAECNNDITGDGQVTTADMLAMLADFGQICP